MNIPEASSYTMVDDPSSLPMVNKPVRALNGTQSMLMYHDIATVSRELGYVMRHLSMAKTYMEILNDRLKLYGDHIRIDDPGYVTIRIMQENLTGFAEQIKEIASLLNEVVADGGKTQS